MIAEHLAYDPDVPPESGDGHPTELTRRERHLERCQARGVCPNPYCYRGILRDVGPRDEPCPVCDGSGAFAPPLDGRIKYRRSIP